jgi:asparagine synthase (glutamine-hydrolysing)
MMLQDFVSYLPGDILVKVDRAAMSFGLEARIPFLDHRVVEFAQKLPIEERTGKKVLRSILQRYVPTKLIDRPKSGFALPIHDWLRGPLFEWADSLISEDRLREENYFDATFIRSMWSEHLSGVRNNQADLWSVLMFQAWQDHHC